jgi:biotin operon repressor
MTDNDELKHVGTPRHSGRYPWGSGENPEQRGTSLRGSIAKLKKQGLTEVEIATGLGLKNTSELRKKVSIEKSEQRNIDLERAVKLRATGMSKIAIAKEMGISDHTVNDLLDPVLKEKANVTKATADMLKDIVDKKKYVDVGEGIENHLAISRTKLNNAIAMLEEEGYKIHYIPEMQKGTGKKTSIKTLAGPDSDWKDVYKNRDQISMIFDKYTEDGGRSWFGLEENSLSSDRIFVRHKDEGGALKDGVIELRRNVPDLSLGGKRYAQVRIGVDGTHFMKGMAIYSDDVPAGFDVIYNTNKALGASKDKIFKPMVKIVVKDKDGKIISEEIDKDNPYGAIVRQRKYIDKDGNEKTSSVNVVGTETKSNEEGSWGEWSRTLSSQVLSKQNLPLAKKQLGLAFDAKKNEYDEIMSLTNPAVKKRLLQTFADETDSAAVDLKAAALPGQRTHVLLPFPSIKENEVFAPLYNDGDSVVLIRHPHGGIFEIPELKVNNKNKEAINAIGRDAKDAVGIHPKVAAKLSGADFDGDTVLVIPNRNKDIKTQDSIKELMEFDTKAAYPRYDGMPKLTPERKEMLMGVASNLITDMTIRAASTSEIVRAVKYSMVVIDAEKHDLNYKQCGIDNGIAALKKKYQGKETAGASTVISKASSEKRMPLRKDQYDIDPVSGKKIYKYITGETYINAQRHKVRVTTPSLEIAKASPGETYINKKGEVVRRTTKSTKMAETDNAFELSSGTNMENIYASHANSLKSLANTARLSYLGTKDIEYSPSAKKAYQKEVTSLNSQLNLAYMNKPYERQAQLLSGKIVTLKRQERPIMTPVELKKVRGQALMEARTRVGAGKHQIDITDREWEAIQAGAISKSKLNSILLNTKIDDLKARALPRTTTAVSEGDLSRARTMITNGHTIAEVASAIGISSSTLGKALQ